MEKEEISIDLDCFLFLYMMEHSRACHGMLGKASFWRWIRRVELDPLEGLSVFNRVQIRLVSSSTRRQTFLKIFFSNSILKIIFGALKVVGLEG